MDEYINLTMDNIDSEHICCAISDKKHQDGVIAKKECIRAKLKDGYVFRKLNDRGKVFIRSKIKHLLKTSKIQSVSGFIFYEV